MAPLSRLLLALPEETRRAFGGLQLRSGAPAARATPSRPCVRVASP
jgi:hypothetical protein